MREQAIQAPPTPASAGAAGAPARRLLALSFVKWPVVAIVVILVSTLFVVATRMRPAFDAYGWLVWGQQALHLSLNTDGAPSWKPLTFLFSFPYALVGRGAMWLWMVTAVAATLSGSVFAARIAYRLTGACPERRYAPVVAGVFAGLGVLGCDGYPHLVLIANSDPMVVSLCLAVIDAHLSRRPRLAFVLLVLAALGRPEAWPFALLYAVWAWRALPSMRVLAVLGLAVIPALSFGIPALTSKSWLRAGDLALNSVNELHGGKFFGVIGRFLGLYPLAMWLAVLCALVLAVVRRDRVALTLAGAALLWVAIEIAFAYHGFSAVPRYMAEPAAVMIVLAGAAVGWVLEGSRRLSPLYGAAGVVAVVVLVAALVPTARRRAQDLHAEISNAHHVSAQENALEAAIARDGAARIRACGQPISTLGNQSLLAWDVGMNVGDVGFRPGKSIDSGRPVVLFKARPASWSVSAFNTPAADRATCDRLRITVRF